MQTATYIHGTAPSEQARLALLNRLTNRPFQDFLALQPHETAVLEVGSGLGILLADLARQHPHIQFYGVEYAAAQLAQCPQGLDNLHFIQGDAHQLPFEAGSFAVVYCRYVLEHLHAPVQALREMYRVLKSGGRAVVQENDIDILRFYPACPTFERVWAQFLALQTTLGGDGTVGRKLYAYFRQVGFHQVTLSLAPQLHGYDDPQYADWVTNIIGNVASAADQLPASGLVTTEELSSAIEELNNLKINPLGSGTFYWNRATGLKP